MDKQTFLDKVQSGRSQWDKLLSLIPHERMTQPGAAGEWSVKDIIAHISWHEQQMVGILQAHAFVGSDLWNLPKDQRNAAIYEQNRQRSLDDVLAEAQQVFPQLVAAIEPLSDNDLNDQGHFPGMPPIWLPWKIIAENSCEHYQQHTGDVQTRLNREKGVMMTQAGKPPARTAKASLWIGLALVVLSTLLFGGLLLLPFAPLSAAAASGCRRRGSVLDRRGVAGERSRHALRQVSRSEDVVWQEEIGRHRPEACHCRSAAC